MNAETTDDSKLRDSIKTYGSNSYYYAHSKKIEIPSDAIRTEGDGLVTGGMPVLLATGTPLAHHDSALNNLHKRLHGYAWGDDGELVKIYIEDPAWLEDAHANKGLIETDFGVRSVSIKVTNTEGVVTLFSIDKLDEDVDPSGCYFRLSAKRFTITLKKTKPTKTWYSLRKN